MFKLYVGNIRFSADEQALRDLFAPFGEVTDVHIAMSRETGKPRGFAFVTLADKAAGEAAMQALNGKEIDGRTLVVNEAQPKGARPDRPFDRGGGPPRGGRPFESRRPDRSGGSGGYRGGGGGGGGGGSRSEWRSSGGPGGRKDPEGEGGRGGRRERREDKDRDRKRYDREDDWN
ncbi:MAG: RNA-binding protein [Phycisphaerales bacterium]|nr:RNA-binding protein [Phycisphaerales bacterium]